MDVPLAVVETITTGLIPVTAVDTTYLTIDVDTLILDTALVFIHPYYTRFQYTSYVINYNRARSGHLPPPMMTVSASLPLPPFVRGSITPLSTHTLVDGLSTIPSSYLTSPQPWSSMMLMMPLAVSLKSYSKARVTPEGTRTRCGRQVPRP